MNFLNELSFNRNDLLFPKLAYTNFSYKNNMIGIGNIQQVTTEILRLHFYNHLF